MDAKVVQVSKLKLPIKLERLCELFNEMEQVCMALFTRKQQITLDSVRRSIAKNAPKYLPPLSVEILAKLVYIFPKAYSIRLSVKAGNPGEASKHYYVLVPNLRDDIYPYYQKPEPARTLTYDSSLVMPSPPVSPQKSRHLGATDYVRSPKKSSVKPLLRSPRLDFGPKFEPWRVKRRSQIFKYKLFEFFKAKHQEFMDNIGVEFKESESFDLFHPEFLLKNLPEVPLAELPVPEKPVIQKTMKDYLKSVDSSPVLRSVEKVTKQLKTPIKTEPGTPTQVETPKNETPMRSKMNLLERIREKERLMKEKEAARDPVLEKRLSRLEELKIHALGIIYSEYKHRSSMEQTALYKRLKFSIVNLRQDDFNGIVGILAEIAPEHFQLDTTTSTTKRYLRMVDKDLAQITKLVEDEIQQCRDKIKALVK